MNMLTKRHDVDPFYTYQQRLRAALSQLCQMAHDTAPLMTVSEIAAP